MDKDTHSAIERATQKARRLLEADFAKQIEGTYDVLVTGAVLQGAGSHHPGSVFPAPAQRIEA